MTRTPPAATVPIARHPVDDALDHYTEAAAASGDPSLIEDAARQHLIRGHRNFDSLVVMVRVNRIPVRPHRRTIHADKLVLTGSMLVTARRDIHDPSDRAQHLASIIADDLRLPRTLWTYRILTLASEYARGDVHPEHTPEHVSPGSVG